MDESIKIDAEEICTDDIVTITANESFGIKYLFPWQRLVISNILDSYEYLNNRDDSKELIDCLGKQIVLLPTGAGKSLCFQIPALLLKGPSLVIYPILALMNDQFRRMSDSGIQTVIFRGGQSQEEREENFNLLENGAKIIIANPEVLSNKKLLERLKTYNISHIAIDEAHCVSEWGDSFRPSYLELGKILKELNVPVVTAFTATASPEVLERISDLLFEGKAHIVRSESDRQNIHYYVKKIACKKTAVLTLIKNEAKPMIIFCGTRSRCEDLSAEINMVYGKNYSRFYHAGLERKEKTKIEEWFFSQKDAVLCATCAYGMGVDKKDIKTVIHFDPPETAEAYIQEAGRGGRDGSISNAILLWNEEDSIKFEQFKKGSRKAAMKEFAESDKCRRQTLLDALGAEEAFCSGCDICDSKKMIKKKEESFPVKIIDKAIKLHKISRSHLLPPSMPGSSLADDEQIAFQIINLCEKYFSKESFEQFFIKYMNSLSRPVVNLNIWNHENFTCVYKQLLSKELIEICRWPWKGKLMIKKNKKIKRSDLRFQKYFLHLPLPDFLRKPLLQEPERL